MTEKSIPEPVLTAVRESLAAFRHGKEVVEGRALVGDSYRNQHRQEVAEREAIFRIARASAHLRRTIRENA